MAKDIAAVVNKNSAVKNVSLADFVRMARTTRKWPDGRPLVLVIRDPATPDMRLVNQKLLGKRTEEVRALIAANRDLFVVVATDADVIKAVAERSNAVGFIDIYSITAAVNILKIDGRPPLEPGYVLWEPSDHGDS
jgi:ABC-type Fe3+ transport system substrate-binding protein